MIFSENRYTLLGIVLWSDQGTGASSSRAKKPTVMGLIRFASSGW
jgi:hypothetical protein